MIAGKLESIDAEASLTIRAITVADAEVAAKLSGELGYPASAQAMKERIQNLERLPDRAVFVACLAQVVVAWIDVGIVHHLQAESYGEIGGLVVSSDSRSRGVGHQLVARAEQWVLDRGINTMIVRSRITREAAHRFYRREGYSVLKTSLVFSKTLRE